MKQIIRIDLPSLNSIYLGDWSLGGRDRNIGSSLIMRSIMAVMIINII